MPIAITATAMNSAIGPQLRPWLTLTGVTGLRGPLPPPPLVRPPPGRPPPGPPPPRAEGAFDPPARPADPPGRPAPATALFEVREFCPPGWGAGVLMLNVPRR